MNILDQTAQKAFESKTVQRSWRIHLQAFGPILEPAFRQDPGSRIALTDALNRISRRDLQGGLEKLRPLQEKCESDADCAAWLFCVGLCFDLAGDTANMVEFYQSAGEYGHRFYLPDQKLARLYYGSRELEGAEVHFRRALECVTEDDLRSRMIRAELQTDLARCLLAMHRYDGALEQLELAEAAFPKMKGLNGSRAMIYAAMDDGDRCAAALERLRQEEPEQAGSVAEAAQKILQGRDAHYRMTRLEEDKIRAFWQWFVRSEQSLRAMTAQEPQAVSEALAARLRPVFPELEFAPEVLLRRREQGCDVALVTGYSISLEEGYGRILRQQPELVDEFWHFEKIS